MGQVSECFGQLIYRLRLIFLMGWHKAVFFFRNVGASHAKPGKGGGFRPLGGGGLGFGWSLQGPQLAVFFN